MGCTRRRSTPRGCRDTPRPRPWPPRPEGGAASAASAAEATRELARICASCVLLAELYSTTASFPLPVGEIAELNSHVAWSFTSPCCRRADAAQAPLPQADGISSYQRITDRPVPLGS